MVLQVLRQACLTTAGRLSEEESEKKIGAEKAQSCPALCMQFGNHEEEQLCSRRKPLVATRDHRQGLRVQRAQAGNQLPRPGNEEFAQWAQIGQKRGSCALSSETGSSALQSEMGLLWPGVRNGILCPRVSCTPEIQRLHPMNCCFLMLKGLAGTGSELCGPDSLC